jgi:hypothetical protein
VIKLKNGKRNELVVLALALIIEEPIEEKNSMT